MNKECPYCHYEDHLVYFSQKKINKCRSDFVDVYVEPLGALEVKTDFEAIEIPVNYCPMCGRKLGDSDA